MDRWACVDVPALPLQLLCLRHPQWVREPVVVVDEDQPNGKILWVNERAYESCVRSGQRYAQGLSLAAGLRAGVVPQESVDAAVERLVERLRKFSPDVEPSIDEPGVFWLDASGLGGVFRSLAAWADGLARDLKKARLSARIVVGFDRFATYALARVSRGVRVLPSRDEERKRVARVPLSRLNLDPKLRDALERLGIEDVGALRRLPTGGLLERFGKAGHRLQRCANGTHAEPLAPAPVVPAVHERLELEPDCPEIDRTGFLFLVKQRLGRMRQVFGERGEAVAVLHVRLLLEDRAPHDESLRPAEPTLDEVQLVDLVRLRLESVEFDAPWVGFELGAETVQASRDQLELFVQNPRRDPKAGDRALARLRAEFGDDAVVRAVLRDGHLPEARFTWEPLEKFRSAEPEANARGRLVRRVLRRPIVLPAQRRDADGWFAGGFERGPVQKLSGPDVISGGWWDRERHREHYFAETRRGDMLWVYYDRARRLWLLHGVVE